MPYELYKGLTFTTIWLEVNSRKKMFERLCLRRAFLIIKVVESSDEKCFNLFLSNDEGDNYFCRSFFPEEKMDYSKNQASWTLLYKKKIDLSTRIETVLYNRIK